MTSCFGSRHGAQGIDPIQPFSLFDLFRTRRCHHGHGYHHVNQLQLENLSLFLFHILLCKQAWCGSSVKLSLDHKWCFSF